MEDVDEIGNSQHTYDRKGFMFPQLQFTVADTSSQILHQTLNLPTNLCNLLSHNGAALKPFATSAKKAFFTFWKSKCQTVSEDLIRE